MKQTIEKIWFQPYTPIILLLLVIAGLGYFIYPPLQKFIRSDKVDDSIPTPSPAAAVLGDDASVIEKVGKLMILPSDETPNVATVTDLERLKDQPFFKNAKTGDRVLIYANSRKAILYDPVYNKIVEVTQIAAPTEEPSPLPTQPEPTATPTKQSKATPTATPKATPTP